MPRTKEAGKRIYFIVIILVYTIEDRAPKTRIVIEVTIKTRKGKRRVRVLVDSDIEANYIKRRLVLDIGIILILKATPLFLPEERRIHLYKDCIFGITTENILENRKEADI
jgi:hypothetical protein